MNRLTHLTSLIVLFLTSTFCMSGMRRVNMADFPMTALCKDSTGRKIPMYYIPTETKPYEVEFYKPGRLIIYENQEVSVYNTNTLDQIVCFTPKKDIEIIAVTDKGYLGINHGSKSSPLFSFRYLPSGRLKFLTFDNRVKWESDETPLYVHKEKGIVICKSGKGKMTGYDINTHKRVWSNLISNKRHSTFCHHHTLSDENALSKDSTISYWITDSLVRINILTGQKKSRPFNAAVDIKKNLLLKLTTNLKPYAYRTFVEELRNSWQVDSVLTGLHSNWIEKGDTLYIADADNLYCYDINLNPIWQTPLPEGMGAKSFIKITGDTIRMLNFAIGFNHGVPQKHGHPFAAKFDAVNGDCLSTTIPNLDKKLSGGEYTDNGRIYWQDYNNFYYTDEGETEVHKVKIKVKSDQLRDPDCADYLLTEVHVPKDGVMQPVRTDDKQIVLLIYGVDVNVVGLDGHTRRIPPEETYYSSTPVYDPHIINLKYDNLPRPQHTFFADTDTKNIVYDFYVQGGVIHSDGNFIVITPRGVGFLPPALQE